MPCNRCTCPSPLRRSTAALVLGEKLAVISSNTLPELEARRVHAARRNTVLGVGTEHFAEAIFGLAAFVVLDRGHRLTAAAHVQAASTQTSAEAFGEFGR